MKTESLHPSATNEPSNNVPSSPVRLTSLISDVRRFLREIFIEENGVEKLYERLCYEIGQETEEEGIKRIGKWFEEVAFLPEGGLAFQGSSRSNKEVRIIKKQGLYWDNVMHHWHQIDAGDVHDVRLQDYLHKLQQGGELAQWATHALFVMLYDSVYYSAVRYGNPDPLFIVFTHPDRPGIDETKRKFYESGLENRFPDVGGVTKIPASRIPVMYRRGAGSRHAFVGGIIKDMLTRDFTKESMTPEVKIISEI